MRIIRQILPIFAIFSGIILFFQVGLQSTPKITLYHTGDGTVCTCGCASLESEADKPVHCQPGGESRLLCLCDQDHEERTSFPTMQLRDLFLDSPAQMNLFIEFTFVVTPSYFFHQSNFIQNIDHPPSIFSSHVVG